MSSSYKESQYEILECGVEEFGIAKFGPMSSLTWNSDPKRLAFVLSRYKFVAKMLEGSRNVLEVGCGDAFGSRIVAQHVSRLTVSDFDPLMLSQARDVQGRAFPVEFLHHDFVQGPLAESKRCFDGAYLLDVLEHVPVASEGLFLGNLAASLTPNAKVVIGMPSLESQEYASAGSKAGHVNCKTKEELKATVERAFDVAFCFSMNDEVVHTGFARMSNYLFAVCVNCAR